MRHRSSPKQLLEPQRLGMPLSGPWALRERVNKVLRNAGSQCVFSHCLNLPRLRKAAMIDAMSAAKVGDSGSKRGRVGRIAFEGESVRTP